MLQKISKFAPIALLGATVSSSGAVTLDSTDVSSVGGALTTAVTSLVTIIIQFAPYLVGMAVAFFVFKWIAKKVNMRKK